MQNVKHHKNLSIASTNSTISSTIYQSMSIHFEQPVTSMSISPNGRDVVLAAKKGMFILDLEAPYEMPKVMQHITKWEVADVQWNPHKDRQNWIASTSNQKVLIWNVALNSNTSSSKHVEMVLTSHTRAVSDLNWSIFNSEMLATCSLDGYIHLWDLKNSNKKPVNSFCAWTAGATQVKWNKMNEWILASSHDSDLRIWDIRKGSTPVSIITAHMNKIYGIDWNNTKENEILTCSQDKLVKFWDINETRVCQGVITTNTPVWRARYTPFGSAVITMPQRNDSQLLMWSVNDLTTPIYSFTGHTDVVREFVWRSKQDNTNEPGDYQLVTWSKDKTLRLWPVNPKQLKLTGNDINNEKEPGLKDIASSSILSETENVPYEIISQSSSNLYQQTPTQTQTQTQTQTPTPTQTQLQIQPDLPTQLQNHLPIQIHNQNQDQDQNPNQNQNQNSESFSSVLSMTFPINEIKPPTLPSTGIDSQSLSLGLNKNKKIGGEEDYDGSYFQEDDEIMTGISNDIERRDQLRESYIPTSLEDEIEWISKRFHSVRFEKVNFTYRTCTITLHHFESYVKPGIPAVYVKVNIQFPPQYPNKAPPTFQIQKTGMISMANRNFMTNKLEEIASSYAEKSLPCLEASILFLLSGDASSTLRISTDNDDVTYPRNVSYFDDLSFSKSSQNDIDNMSNSSSDNLSTIENYNKPSYKKKKSKKNQFQYPSTQYVPYPCLCGAKFSPTGKLIVFFSPLPHPSETKFTTHTLGTHNQQPILQTTQFTTQPKTFDLYDSYRNFILVRYPKVFLTGSGGGGVNQDTLRTEDPIMSTNQIIPNSVADKIDEGSDGKLNLWFDMDEEDQEETPMPSLFYKPKPNSTLQPALASTSNFLRRVKQCTKAKPDISSSYSRSLIPGSLMSSMFSPLSKMDPNSIDARESFPIDTQIHHQRQYIPSNILNKTNKATTTTSIANVNAQSSPYNKLDNSQLSNMSGNDIFTDENLSILSQPPSSHESDSTSASQSTIPIVMNKRYHAYHYSGGISGLSTSKSSNGLCESITQSTISSFNDSIHSNEEITTREGIDENNYSEVPVFSIEEKEKENEKDMLNEEDSAYFGASIYIKDIQKLLPINKKLAKDYTLHGDDAIVICAKNCRAAKKNNRPDLVKIWGIIGLILSKYRKSILSNYEFNGKQVYEEKVSISWKWHPFGRHLVNTIFSYLEKQGDVQTLALLTCVFSIPYKNENKLSYQINNMTDVDGLEQKQALLNNTLNQTKNPLLLNVSSQLDYKGSFSPLGGNMVDGYPATTFTPSRLTKPTKMHNIQPSIITENPMTNINGNIQQNHYLSNEQIIHQQPQFQKVYIHPQNPNINENDSYPYSQQTLIQYPNKMEIQNSDEINENAHNIYLKMVQQSHNNLNNNKLSKPNYQIQYIENPNLTTNNQIPQPQFQQVVTLNQPIQYISELNPKLQFQYNIQNNNKPLNSQQLHQQYPINRNINYNNNNAYILTQPNTISHQQPHPSLINNPNIISTTNNNNISILPISMAPQQQSQSQHIQQQIQIQHQLQQQLQHQHQLQQQQQQQQQQTPVIIPSKQQYQSKVEHLKAAFGYGSTINTATTTNSNEIIDLNNKAGVGNKPALIGKNANENIPSNGMVGDGFIPSNTMTPNINDTPSSTLISNAPTSIFRKPIISTTTNYNNFKITNFIRNNNTSSNANVSVGKMVYESPINIGQSQQLQLQENNELINYSLENQNQTMNNGEMNNNNYYFINNINPNAASTLVNSSMMGNINQLSSIHMNNTMANSNVNILQNEAVITRIQPYGEFDDEEGGAIFVPLIDPNQQIIYDRYRLVYAEILYSWGYLEQRAEILKFVTEQNLHTTDSPTFELTVKCSTCEKDLIPSNKGFYCMRCNKNKRGSICSICRLPVRGLTNFCMICNHGGHAEHIKNWFVKEKNVLCPSGCGCKCIYMNNGLNGIIP